MSSKIITKDYIKYILSNLIISNLFIYFFDSSNPEFKSHQGNDDRTDSEGNSEDQGDDGDARSDSGAEKLRLSILSCVREDGR